MRIRNDAEVPAAPVEMAGAKGVRKQVLLGPEDGSHLIVVRCFTVAPGGHTPRHQHGYEHLVRVLSGHGTAVDGKGAEHALEPGRNIFVAPDEEHQFVNRGNEPFVFTCTIMNPEAPRPEGYSGQAY